MAGSVRGSVGMMRIEIHDADPTWPERFRIVAGTLRGTFGQAPERIDHIGSTSVPGLGAKDIIDIQITAHTLDDKRIVGAIEAAGLTVRTNIDRDHQPPGRSLATDELAKRYAQGDRINCHIRQEGRFNQRYALLCRDYLRTHPLAAAAYEAFKCELARRFGDNAQGYYDIKDPVFDIIMEGAYAWADTTAWEPGPGDA